MLPFDHRSSFSRDLLGLTGTLTPENHARVTELKEIVYQGFLLVANEVSDHASYAILADNEYSARILNDARRKGFTIAMPIEKSGQDEFQFAEKEWKEQIERVKPHIVKALVRYNPRGDAAMNRRQLARLASVADYCHRTHRLFLFELLVPPTSAQKKSYGERYDAALRPALATEAIAAIQAVVDVDIWKIEALPAEDWRAAIRAADTTQRPTRPVFIVLGRNAPTTTVENWLRDAAPHEDIVGFAVGRTVFEKPLERYIAGDIGKEIAARQIASSFRHFSTVWRGLKKAHPPRHHR
jgi:5-dehydro-2-deoxygluconokinase